MSNLSPTPQTHYFQYVNITLVNGEHEFTYQKFLETASPDGLTDVEIEMFLRDQHDLRDNSDSDGLRDGFFWTNNQTAAGVFPTARKNETEARVVSSNDPDIAQLMQLAPELFDYQW